MLLTNFRISSPRFASRGGGAHLPSDGGVLLLQRETDRSLGPVAKSSGTRRKIKAAVGTTRLRLFKVAVIVVVAE